MARTDDLLSGFKVMPGSDPRHDPMVEWPFELVPHLSASSLGMFLRCPEQWRRRYLLGEKRPPVWHMVLGSANHATHERTYNEKLRGREVSPREAVEYFEDQAWPEQLVKEGEVLWQAQTPDSCVDTGARMVNAYTAHVVPRILPESAGEQKFEIEVPGLPVPVIGYTDVIINDGPVLDIKTVGQATRSIQKRWMLQANIYNLALGRGIEIHTVSRAKEPKVFTALDEEGLLLPASEQQNALTQRMVQQVTGMIWNCIRHFGPLEPWPANFMSDACGWCGWFDTCVYWSHRRGE